MGSVVEVGCPNFLINMENPLEVSYGGVHIDDNDIWKKVSCQAFECLPEPRSGEILYRLLGTSNRGFLLQFAPAFPTTSPDNFEKRLLLM